MWRVLVKPNVISYNAAISSGEKGQRREQALSTLQEMWLSQLEPGHQRTRERPAVAAGLKSQNMRRSQLAASVISYNSSITLGAQ